MEASESKVSKEKRRKWSPERRASILREHVIDKKQVSDICDAHGIQPSLSRARRA